MLVPVRDAMRKKHEQTQDVNLVCLEALTTFLKWELESRRNNGVKLASLFSCPEGEMRHVLESFNRKIQSSTV